jgi:hypothetical protein
MTTDKFLSACLFVNSLQPRRQATARSSKAATGHQLAVATRRMLRGWLKQQDRLTRLGVFTAPRLPASIAQLRPVDFLSIGQGNRTATNKVSHIQSLEAAA